MSARCCCTPSRCATACCREWRLRFECDRHTGERAHPRVRAAASRWLTRRPTLRIRTRPHPQASRLHYMNAPTPPRTLADTGGLVVTDDGRRVLVIDRCTGALTVLAFVLGVLTLVVGGFGAVALATGVPSVALGAAFLAVGVV